MATDSPEVPAKVDVVVIGAGFSGLGLLRRLRDEEGFSVQVFEAAPDVGGTWYWNRYPGARCDSMSFTYTFSFSDEMLRDWEWAEKYPAQPDVLEYLGHVADRFDLRRNIAFNTRVTSAVYDTDRHVWQISTDAGHTVECQFCVTAVGCLSTPQAPSLPGIAAFTGQTYHSAEWPHEPVDFSGQRVGVIGTGSTGIQIIPLVAEQAAHLTVFQRTPNFSFPARNHLMSEDQKREIQDSILELREQVKHTLTGNVFMPKETLTFEVDDEERRRQYEVDWADGSLRLLFGGYGDLMTDAAANDTAAEFVRSKIREIVRDPAVADRLAPTDHPVGTKRPCLDTHYYETFNRDNVTLVDIKAAPIVELTERTLRTETAEYELDALIFATGFDAMTGSLSRIDIRTSEGAALKDKWADGPQTYLGLTVVGFPNLFLMTGPGSPSVFSNMPVSIEQHIDMVAACLTRVRDQGFDYVEPTPTAERDWTAHTQEIAHQTLMPRADSWYMGANTPGKARVMYAYAGGVGPYRELWAEVVADGYRGLSFGRARAEAAVSSSSA